MLKLVPISVNHEKIITFDTKIKKTSRLLRAAAKNDVETLRELLDSPKWYKVRDKFGYGLLHIAVKENKKEVFDYLLSIKDFPLEAVNHNNLTALGVVLSGFLGNNVFMSDYFSLELIKKGAELHHICFDGNTLLHCAFYKNFIEVAKLLIEKGVDLNIQNDNGCTPLHMCCYECSDVNLIEGVSMLLCYGADPFIRDHRGFTALDIVIQLRNDKLMAVKENLLYYTLDQYTQYEITDDNLFIVAESPFFYQIVDHVTKVDFHSSTDDHCLALFKMKPEYLRVLIDKFDYVIRQIFLNHSKDCYVGDVNLISIENFNILEESKLKLEMINFLSNFNNSSFIAEIIESGRSESVITELVCYLLSYGMSIHEYHLKMIFHKFGYCELFKILLHMDFKIQMEQRKTRDIMPRLIYDIHFDIQQIIEDPFDCFVEDLQLLLPLYVLSKLKNLYVDGNLLEAKYASIAETVKNQPQIPLLVELARNVFRRYFTRRFHITTSRQFYTMLKLLPISVNHERIITYETKLY
ncbi:Ankyrin repeat domain containing protein, partial [Asbolus verrucosus]